MQSLRKSFIVLALGAWCVSSAVAQVKPSAVQTCQLGDFKLESGDVIRDLRMTYITFGTLDEKRSNAILSLHGLQGNRNSQTYWVGRGKAFDPERYFIIQPDTLGVASTDPNATTSADTLGAQHEIPALQHPRHGERRVSDADPVPEDPTSRRGRGQFDGRDRDAAMGRELSRLHGSSHSADADGACEPTGQFRLGSRCGRS